jgi:DNA-binding HxlR family transcriptional regulator
MYIRKESSTNNENRESIKRLCALGKAMGLIEGRWKVVIIWNLREGKMRFSEIEKSIAFASKRMLIKQLKEMEIDNIITRKTFGDKAPFVVDYELSNLGLKLLPIVKELRGWGQELPF